MSENAATERTDLFELSARGLFKSYDRTDVLSDVSISLKSGRVRSVVGENGAGKSTLMRILSGVTTPDRGQLQMNGRAVTMASPSAATHLGVVMVHQELALIPGLSVADNIMLARPSGAPWRIRGGRAGREFVSRAIAKVGLAISPSTKVEDLSLSQAYLVEIAKALALDARVIIFDEPTAALPAEESAIILSQIDTLRRAGCAVVFISHRLDEVRAISDDITVMRDGRVVGDFTGEVSEDEMIQLMVERQVGLYKSERPVPGSDVLLSVNGLTTRRVHDVTFDLCAGEILGFAGLVGAGRSETALALVGADPVKAGSVKLAEIELAGKSASTIRKSGIVIVPEDRKHQSIVKGLSVHENLHVGNLLTFARFGLLNERELRLASDAAKSMFDIRFKSFRQKIETLSGGNQQKVILARAIETSPQVLILDEPTRGVDVKAKDEIHRLILRLAAGGTAIVLISSELEEVMALSHRILVFAEGQVAGEVDNSTNISAEDLMRLATPRKPDERSVTQ